MIALDFLCYSITIGFVVVSFIAACWVEPPLSARAIIAKLENEDESNEAETECDCHLG